MRLIAQARSFVVNIESAPRNVNELISWGKYDTFHPLLNPRLSHITPRKEDTEFCRGPAIIYLVSFDYDLDVFSFVYGLREYRFRPVGLLYFLAIGAFRPELQLAYRILCASSEFRSSGKSEPQFFALDSVKTVGPAKIRKLDLQPTTEVILATTPIACCPIPVRRITVPRRI
jgi:hypothetical protein